MLKRLIAVGVASYLVALIVTVPVSLVVDTFVPRNSKTEFTVSDARGSIWSGEADLRMESVGLGRLSWQLQPLSLFLGRAEADFKLKRPDAHLNGRALVALDQTVTLSGLEGKIPLFLIHAFLPISGLPVVAEGEISLHMDSVELVQGIPRSAEGVLLWQQAGLSAPQQLDFGDLRMTLTTQKSGGIKGMIEDGGGPLQAEGSVLLEQDGSYRINLAIAARDKQQQNLVQAVSMLGRPDSGGMTSFSYSGKL